LLTGEQDDAPCSPTDSGRVLRLLQQLGHALAALQLLAGGVVEVGRELREGGQFAVLRQVETGYRRRAS
jgi:hypothetical protein